jgi:alpha-amylase
VSILHRVLAAATNQIQQIGQALESWVSPAFKPLAYSMILLRGEGYPYAHDSARLHRRALTLCHSCVFWGDLYGCGGENPQPPVAQLADIIRARKLFAYGETRDYWDHQNCVGWVRAGDAAYDGCAVVLSNGEEGCAPPIAPAYAWGHADGMRPAA